MTLLVVSEQDFITSRKYNISTMKQHKTSVAKTLKHILLGGLFIFTAFVILYPNPFGNNPDLIADESYFLTSSLAAIEKTTLPGWEFSKSGNYYGGTQTYIDYIALIPVIGAVAASHGFSVTSTKLWVALNTGELLHALRIVNGLLALGALVACYLYFSRRNIPLKLATTLTLFLSLLLSNVLIIEFLHTAKVWVVYIIITSIMSALFIANEYYLSNLKEAFIKKETYVALLVWSSVLVFFQNYVGAISIFLIILYAVLLEHIKITDILNYLRRYWYLGVIFALTQISFIYRAIFLNWLTGSFAQITATDAAGVTDWHMKIFNPIIFSLQSHPLAALLFVVGIGGIIILALKDRSFLEDRRKKTYLFIALVHPVLVYLIFHIGIGFSFTVRYAIFLTLAFAFSAAILLSATRPLLEKIAIVCSTALFFVIGAQAISLYWHPSSEVSLLKQIEKDYNTPKNVFIGKPDALHLTLPINTESLFLLNKKRQEMGRFQFLIQNKELLSNMSFKPLTVITYTEEELAEMIAQFQKSSNTIWTITTQCDNLCTATELQSKTCFEVHIDACGLNSSHEINLLSDFFSARQLGNSYIVRRVN